MEQMIWKGEAGRATRNTRTQKMKGRKRRRELAESKKHVLLSRREATSEGIIKPTGEMKREMFRQKKKWKEIHRIVKMMVNGRDPKTLRIKKMKKLKIKETIRKMEGSR